MRTKESARLQILSALRACDAKTRDNSVKRTLRLEHSSVYSGYGRAGASRHRRSAQVRVARAWADESRVRTFVRRIRGRAARSEFELVRLGPVSGRSRQ